MKQTKNKAAKAAALFFVLGLVVFELPLFKGALLRLQQKDDAKVLGAGALLAVLGKPCHCVRRQGLRL